MNTSQILGNIAAYALQIGLLVGIGAAVPALVGLRNGKAPGARLLYWQALLAACIALPWMRPWHTDVITVSRGALAAVAVMTGPAVPVAARFSLPSPVTIALLILGAGAALRALWLLFGFLKLARHRRRGVELPLPPEWIGMAGGAAILISEEVEGPVTFGFFRPVVLLPPGFPEMPKAMRDAILSHELLHVARGDWAYTLIEECVRAAFWFHPAIWWVLGEIQLAREQTVDRAVIEMTQARDPYVDTLLAMAGVAAAIEADLAPAPSFLRRRHLKQRVIGLIQETPMSKTRKLLAQSAALALMAAASWFVTGAIPLHAQSRTVTDGPGVTVNLAGVQMLHRPPLYYPAGALKNGVEGTVVAQAHVAANGEVIDDAILSGPDELRKDVQQAILNWHFDGSDGSATRVVNITFAKPAEPSTPSVAMVPMPTIVPVTPPTPVRVAGGLYDYFSATSSPTVSEIVIDGLSDEAAERLRAQLPVHAGDAYTADLRQKTFEAARNFDEHLRISLNDISGGATLRISAPDAPFHSEPHEIPAGAQRVGASVQAANLIHAVRPVYPPLAKKARQQGTVRLQTLIGPDGAVQDLQVLPGAPPLLVQAAIMAVKQWTYRPTLLHGAPVAVATTVDVNFSLTN